MDRKIAEYKQQIEKIAFSESFLRDTTELMRTAKERENNMMNKKKTIKTAIALAAIIALLTTTVFALPLLMSPKEVAERFEENTVAAAFESEGAVQINESIVTDEYCITLQAMVDGEKLVCIDGEWLNEDRSYMVFSIARTDGTPITIDDELFMLSPLVAGYDVWKVNAWSLEASGHYTHENGIRYYLFDYANLEMFADRTVYLAAYEGSLAPSPDIFTMDEAGNIDYRDDYTGIRAMFKLPLDPEKADPEAAARFLEEYC